MMVIYSDHEMTDIESVVLASDGIAPGVLGRGDVTPMRERARIENRKLEESWDICCSRTSSRCIKYSAQMGVALLILTFSMVQIFRGVDDREVYFSLVSFVIGLVFPHPTLGKGQRP
jgi:hypothetical protein